MSVAVVVGLFLVNAAVVYVVLYLIERARKNATRKKLPRPTVDVTLPRPAVDATFPRPAVDVTGACGAIGCPNKRPHSHVADLARRLKDSP